LRASKDDNTPPPFEAFASLGTSSDERNCAHAGVTADASTQGRFMNPETLSSWQVWALLSAVFAALTAIFAKIGVEDINPDLATFIRDSELIHVRIADLPRHHMWSLLAQQCNLGPLNCERGLVFDTALLAVQYALSGEGLALVDVNLFAEDLRAGRLVRPFDVTLDDGYGYYLITQAEALSDTAIALFRTWLIEHFGPKKPSEDPRVRIAVSNE